MSSPHKNPELYLIRVGGRAVVAVAAKTRGEVNEFIKENSILTIERATSIDAFNAAARLQLQYAKPEYKPSAQTDIEAGEAAATGQNGLAGQMDMGGDGDGPAT